MASIKGMALEGAKERIISDVLQWLIDRGLTRVMVTLSDKDPSEINALTKKFPSAKHQICYWHAIRYLRDRLTKDEAPGHYNPRTANKAFSFIDPTWAPGITRNGSEDELPATNILMENNEVSLQSVWQLH